MKVHYIISGSGVINMFAGEAYITPIRSDHPNYATICKLLSKHHGEIELDRLKQVVDIGEGIKVFTHGKITIEENEIYYDGKRLHNVLTERLCQLMKEGHCFRPLIRFLDNLMSNSSHHSVEQLYNFLKNKGLPLTEDGCFLAYKAVDSNYKDKWTHKIDNNVGNTVKVPRNQVVDNPDQACAKGLHVGALEYVQSYGNGRTDNYIIVKINPRDVVSVPNDCNCQKARVCEYLVVYKMDAPDTLLPGTLYSVDGKQIESSHFRDAVHNIFTNPATQYFEGDDDDEDDWCIDCGELTENCRCEDDEFCLFCSLPIKACECDDEDDYDEWEDNDDDDYGPTW